MDGQATIQITYAIFVWLVVLHTFEEIASGVFDLEIRGHQTGKKRYLLAASGISTLNMVTLVLLILGLPVGYFLGLL
jgi:hypothetical protein